MKFITNYHNQNLDMHLSTDYRLSLYKNKSYCRPRMVANKTKRAKQQFLVEHNQQPYAVVEKLLLATIGGC